MDELEISGKRYISTRRAAKEHGYHSDYMGQLIRGKKVVGQKVGRAWYIEEDSLNTYLGKAPAAPAVLKVERVVEAPAPAPAPVVPPTPVERLVVEEVVPEPAPALAPEPVAIPVAVAPEPAPIVVEEILKEEERPVVVHTSAPVYATPVAPRPVQEIHHAPIAPIYREEERRIPIHTPAPAPRVEEMGGLRYAADDLPSMPTVTRMPQQHSYAPVQQQYDYAPKASTARFPYVSLSIIGIMALLASVFASNFVTATVVTEEGKAATVQYAIHW